jgi:hypothetical protein
VRPGLIVGLSGFSCGIAQHEFLRDGFLARGPRQLLAMLFVDFSLPGERLVNSGPSLEGASAPAAEPRMWFLKNHEDFRILRMLWIMEDSDERDSSCIGCPKELCLQEPVQITKYGRETVYLISADTFHQMWQSYQRAMSTAEIDRRGDGLDQSGRGAGGARLRLRRRR